MESAAMVQGVSGSKLRDIAKREHAVALEAYCASLSTIANALDEGLPPTAEQLEQAQAAKLRVENARTLLQLSIDATTFGIVTTRHRPVSRIHQSVRTRLQ